MQKTRKIFKILPSVNMLLPLIILCVATACTDRAGSDKSKTNTTIHKADTLPPTRSAEQHTPLLNIDDIKKAYTVVNKELEDGQLDSTTFKYSCNDEKNGTVSYFTKNGKLKLIVHKYNEYDHYEAVDRYFVQDSTLFFTYSTSITWSFDNGPEGSTKDNIKENRTYLIAEKPVKCLEKNFTIRSKASSNPDPESIPNRDVKCLSAAMVLKPYHILTKYRFKSTANCLE
jgi:hypothetical protein